MTQRKDIRIHPYNLRWPQIFDLEADKIRTQLKSACLAIHHIGSTSVPGLCAKEDIDILCVVSDLKDSLTLQDVGYIFKGEINVPLRYYFSKKTHESNVNLHVCEVDHGFINLNLTFRDYIRHNDRALTDYAHLKQTLMTDPDSCVRVDGRFTGYTLGKDQFIKKVLNQSGYDGVTYNFCLHYKEWEAAEQLSGSPVKELVDAIHMVMYQGTQIIGYAQIRPDQTYILWMAEGTRSDLDQFEIFIQYWIRHTAEI